MSELILSLRELEVVVRSNGGRSTKILQSASMDVMRGETVAIIGPSGGGKSSLLKAILGLVPFSAGTMTYKDHRILRPLDRAHRDLRASTEAVFQNPMSALNPYATLRATIAEPLISRGLPPADIDVLVEKTALRMGLTSEQLDRRPAAVSLGQAQRACIARALIPKPQVLVLDEPLSALDALIAAEVADLLTEVIAETRPTVLFVSHDMRLVRRLATRVIVIEQGKIVEDALTDRILDVPESAAARDLVGSDRRRRAAFAAARSHTNTDARTETSA
ncbi:MAG: dipeptide/oligopeptide/nickel ABC transporter ATP-binding protein [Pseudomonadota bacterium]